MSWDHKLRPKRRPAVIAKPYPTPEVGHRFERLVILDSTPIIQLIGGSKIKKYKVRCDCGVEKAVRGTDLWDGTTKSCGCLSKEKHSQWGATVWSYRKRLKSFK